MSYDPLTDFLALIRTGAPGTLARMPGVDFVLAALGRAGLVFVWAGATAPVSNQPVTIWIKTANPTFSAEATIFLWDAAANGGLGGYVLATPALFGKMIAVASGLPVNTIRTSVGVPNNLSGIDGDYCVNESNGDLYGPKASNAWPAKPAIYGRRSLLGPNIIVGNSSGVAPINTVGENSQYFLDVSTGDIYGPKDADAWPATPSFLSPSALPTSLMLVGATNGVAPLNSVGKNGNYFQDTITGNIYGPKDADVWPAVPAAYGDIRDVLPTSFETSTFTVGVLMSQTLSTKGMTAPVTWALIAGALPAGVLFNGSTGVLSGTPGAPGAYSFTVQATDAQGVVRSRAYSGNVNVGVSIAVTPVALDALIVGRPFAQRVTPSNGLGPYQFALSAGALPAGLQLDSATGIISGFPTTAGSYSFTIATVDANGNTGSQAFSGRVGASQTTFAGTGPSAITNNSATSVPIGASSGPDFTVAGNTATVVTPGKYNWKVDVLFTFDVATAVPGTVQAALKRNGSALHTANNWLTPAAASATYSLRIHGDVILDLTAGQTLTLELYLNFPSVPANQEFTVSNHSLTRVS